MKKSQIILQREGGLHLRVAAQIVKEVKDHRSAVHFRRDGGAQANAASIFELLALGAMEGAPIDITVDGPDEEATLQALSEVFEGGAGI